MPRKPKPETDKHLAAENAELRARLAEAEDTLRTTLFAVADDASATAIAPSNLADQDLRESEERLRLSLQAANQGLYDLNVQTGTAIVNREYAQMLGYEPETFIETNAAWIERLHPDDQEITAKAYSDYVNGLTSEYRIEFRQKTKDGDWKWILSLGKIVEHDADGKPVRMLGTHTDITDRKLAEQELIKAKQKAEENEAKFRNIFEKSGDAILIIENGCFVDCNIATVEMLGYKTKEEFLDVHPSVLSPEKQPDCRSSSEKAEEMMNLALVNGTHRFEWMHLKRSGEIFPVEVLLTAISNETGNKVIHCVWRDITERKMAEEALLESENRLRIIAEGTKALLVAVDASGHFTFANEAMAKSAGVSDPSELIGMPYLHYVHPEDRTFVLNSFRDQANSLEPTRTLEFRLVETAGDIRWYSFLSSLEIKDGQVIGQSGVAQDITERRRAEETLKESEERYRDLVENSLELITTHDLNGQILTANRAAEEVLGYLRSEYIGKANLRDLLAPEGRDRFDEYIARLKNDGFASGLMVIQTRTGERRIWEYYNTLRTEGVGIPIVRSMARDITERRRAEQHLQYTTHMLERTSELAKLGGWELDLRTMKRFWSKQTCRMLEIDPPITPLLSDRESDFSFYHPESVPIIKAAVQQGIESGTGYDLEVQMITTTGRTIWVREQGSFDMVAGKAIRIHGILQDITDRRKMEADLAQVEQTYSDILNTITDAVYVLDETFTFIDINKGAERMYQMSREELLGQSPGTVAADGLNDLDKIGAMMRTVSETGDPVTFEFIAKRKNGEIFPKEVIVNKGHYFGRDVLIATARDISERKRSEEKLRQLSQAVEQSPATILITDITGAIQYVNRAFMRTTGYTSDEVLGQNSRILKSGETPHEEYELLWETIRAGEEWRGEFHNRRKNGEFYWEAASISPIIDDDGHITHFLAVKEDITERKQANEALRESELLYRTLFDGMLDGVYRSTHDGRFVDFNRAMMTIFGYSSREEMLQVDIAKDLFFDESDRDISGLEKTDIFRMRRKDGSAIWVEDHGRYVYDEQGGVLYHEGILRDITERKLAEDRLSESETLLSESQRIAGLGSYFLDISTGVWSSSDVLDGLLGMDESFERTIEGWTGLIHPDDQKMMADYFSDEVVGRKQPFDKEYRIIRQNDQAERWVHGLGRLEFDSEGRPVTMRGTILDITESKRVVEALRESEEIFSSAFEFAPIGMAMLSLDGKWIRANLALSELVGYTEDELLELHWQDITHPDDIEIDSEDTARLVAGEIGMYQFEKRYVHKLGHSVNGLVNVSLVRDVNGAPQYFVSQIQNLTALRELEERFRQSQKMEAIGVLAGGVAHDFNNLLTVINGYASLILAKLRPDDPLRSHVAEIKGAGDRAAELTARLLAFSRKEILRPVVLNLNSVITDTEKLLRRLIREDVELQVDLDPGLGNIEADQGQIEQMILNLAVNSSDAMPAGGKLTIKTEDVYLDNDHQGRNMTITPGRHIKLTVTDTGQGIAAETQLRIFEPFFTTKEVGKGTGLGLSTVYGTVKFAGGDIEVYSQPDQGTTFTIYFPTVAELVRNPELTDGGFAINRGKETILLVEDEDMVRGLVSSILKSGGFKVLEASNGVDALSVCNSYSGPIHMLLTDMVMPKMSGMELKEKVVKLHPDIKVLFMSGYTQDSIEQGGAADPNVDFIGKPFKSASIALKVRELLDR